MEHCGADDPPSGLERSSERTRAALIATCPTACQKIMSLYRRTPGRCRGARRSNVGGAGPGPSMVDGPTASRVSWIVLLRFLRAVGAEGHRSTRGWSAWPAGRGCTAEASPGTR
jgi:hypothetical protein